MLFVGDFYQHTFDTSRDGATNSTLFNSKAKYESRFTAKGFICDNTSLVNSWRCSKNVCQFYTTSEVYTIFGMASVNIWNPWFYSGEVWARAIGQWFHAVPVFGRAWWNCYEIVIFQWQHYTSTGSCPQNWPGVPSWSANFDDTASNAVSSRLSGLFQLGNFFIFPLMTNAVFTQRCGLEPRQSHFMRNLRCGKHTCRMKALRFSKNKYHKNLSAGSLVLQNQRSGAFVISGGELMSKWVR